MRSSTKAAWTALVLIVSAAAHADIAPEPLGAAAAPVPGTSLRNLTVSMADEDVVIELHDGFAVVDATFRMTNSGESVSLRPAFPGEGVIIAGGNHLAHRRLIGFTTWVDGKVVPATERKEEFEWKAGPAWKHRTETWHTFPATFRRGKVATIRVRYAVLADPYRGSAWRTDERFEDGSVAYILATGRAWAGTIGLATIHVRTADNIPLNFVRIRDNRMPPLQKNVTGKPPAAALPKYALRTPTEILLTRMEFEPGMGDNIEIAYPWNTPREWRNDTSTEERIERLALAEVQRAPRN